MENIRIASPNQNREPTTTSAFEATPTARHTAVDVAGDVVGGGV